MWSPQELIGQKVWLELEPAQFYGEQRYGEQQLRPDETLRVQAELLQPTSPPWFYARYLNPPVTVKTPGQWLSLHDAQQAALLNPVIEEFEDDELSYLPEDYSNEEYDSALDLPTGDEPELIPEEQPSFRLQDSLPGRRSQR
jgi:hypothetical protein